MDNFLKVALCCWISGGWISGGWMDLLIAESQIFGSAVAGLVFPDAIGGFEVSEFVFYSAWLFSFFTCFSLKPLYLIVSVKI